MNLNRSEAIEREKRMDTFIRRVLEKLGGTLDAKIGDDGLRQLGLKLATLAQRAVEEAHREENGRRIAPHTVTLVLPFQLHSELGDTGRAALVEIVASVLESHVRDRRFVTLAPLNISVGSDLFRDAPSVRAGFEEAPVSGSAKAIRISDGYGRELFSAPLGNGAVVRVGRARDNSLPIEDSSISKYHATISVTADGTITVQDLGSTNGTFYNGHPAHAPVSISSGAKVTFGEVSVSVRVGE
jgi:hypothetical protein